MSFRKRMAEKRKKLKRNVSNPNKRRNDRRYQSIILKDKLPEGVGIWRCGEGEHLIDIIPFECGPDMPLDATGKSVAEEGELWHMLDIWVHQNIGALQTPFVCPYENFGEPCPICAFMKENRLPKEVWSKIRAKHRNVYLIWCHDDIKEEKKGIQIWEVADFFMGEKIEDIATLPRGGGYIEYFDYDDGKTIVFSKKGKRDNVQFTGHKFIDRDGPIPERILDQTFPLDSVIKMRPSYEEIEKEFRGMNLSVEEENDNLPPFDSEKEDDVPIGGDEPPKRDKFKRKKRILRRKK